MRDLSKIYAPKAVQTEKNRKGEGYITIVNSKKNGKRIELLNRLTDIINFNDSIKVGFLGNEFVIVPTDAKIELQTFYCLLSYLLPLFSFYLYLVFASLTISISCVSIILYLSFCVFPFSGVWTIHPEHMQFKLENRVIILPFYTVL